MFVLNKMYIAFLSDWKAIHFFTVERKRVPTKEVGAASSIYLIEITLFKVYLDCSPNKITTPRKIEAQAMKPF